MLLKSETGLGWVDSFYWWIGGWRYILGELDWVGGCGGGLVKVYFGWVDNFYGWVGWGGGEWRYILGGWG